MLYLHCAVIKFEFPELTESDRLCSSIPI